jgi:hypothetical protein
MSEEPLTRSVLASVLAEFHAKVIPDVNRVVEWLANIDMRLNDIDCRLYEIEGRRYRLPPRFNETLDRVDELTMRFEGTETRLEQLAEQILDLEISTRTGHMVEDRSRTSH